MPSTERLITGSPYSAVLIEGDNGSIGASWAEAVIDPPVSFGDTTMIADLMFDKAGAYETTFNHIVSTQSKTLLEIQVESDGESDEAHAARMQVAYDGLSRMVDIFNQLEQGKYKGL